MFLYSPTPKAFLFIYRVFSTSLAPPSLLRQRRGTYWSHLTLYILHLSFIHSFNFSSMSSNSYFRAPPAISFPVPTSPVTEPDSPYNSGFRSCSNPSSIHASDEDLSRELTRTSYSGAKVHLVPGMFSDQHQARTRAITMPSNTTAPLSIVSRKSSAISMSKNDSNRAGGLNEPSRPSQEMELSSFPICFPPARSNRAEEFIHPDEDKYMTQSPELLGDPNYLQSQQEIPVVPFTSPPSLPETESSLSISTVSSSFSSRIPLTPTYISPEKNHITADAHRLIASVLDYRAFQSLVTMEAGRDCFRAWLAADADLNRLGLAKLDRYLDETRADALVKTVRDYSMSLYSLYHSQRTETSIVVPKHVNESALMNISHLATLESGLGKTSAYLLKSLYCNEFQGFIHAKLIEQTQISIGREPGSDSSDSFCLCNPRLNDNPIVMVSRGFVELTGYQPHEVIGRNPRFFQRNSRRGLPYLRDAVASSRACCELILNYHKDGTPFYCLLNIVPLFDSRGELMFWIGAQTNVTGEILGSNEFFEPRVSPSPASAVKQQVQRGLPRDTLPNESPRMRAHEDQLFHSSRPASSFSSLLGRNSRASGSSQTLNRIGTENGNEPPSRSIVGQIKSVIKKEPSMGSVTMTGFPPSNASHHPSSIGKITATSVSEALGSALGPFQEQLSLFSSTYSQFLIFERHTHKVVYTGQECLKFFGLPMDSHEDTLAPAILHHNLLDTIYGENGKKTKEIRQYVANAIAGGQPVSCDCFIKWDLGVKVQANSDRQTFSRVTKTAHMSTYSCSIYFTPLLTKNDKSVVYTAVLM